MRSRASKDAPIRTEPDALAASPAWARGRHRDLSVASTDPPGVSSRTPPGSAHLAQLFGRLEVDRHQLADALLGHGDAEQPVHPRHGDRIVGDDDEAGV